MTVPGTPKKNCYDVYDFLLLGKPENDTGFFDAEVKEGAVQECTEFMRIKADELASEDLILTPEQIWTKLVTS
eukprot:1735705-Ditylum_brightwellii.AAC.1